MKFNLQNLKNLNPYLVMAILATVGFIIFLLIATGACQKIKPGIKTQISLINTGEKVFYPYLTKDGQSLYYFGNQGIKLEKFDLQTNKIAVVYPDDIYYTVQTIWSPDETKMIIKNNDPSSSTSFRLLNLQTKGLSNLDKNIENIVWSPNNQIIALSKDDDNYLLKKLSSNGSTGQTFLNLKNNRCDTITSVNKDLDNFTCLANESDIIARLKTVDVANNKIAQIDGEYSWAIGDHNGDKIIALKSENNKSFLAIVDALGNLKSSADLKISFYDPAKIAWSMDDKFIIIAVREEKKTSDSLYKIDVETGKLEKIKFDSGTLKLDIQNLQLSPDNKTLYFTSDNLLYTLELK